MYKKKNNEIEIIPEKLTKWSKISLQRNREDLPVSNTKGGSAYTREGGTKQMGRVLFRAI